MPTTTHDIASAGWQLRQLREERGLSQFDLDLDGIVSQRNLSTIERGQTHPSREKLDAILKRLEAGFNDRQSITEAFGYRAPTPLPTIQELADAASHYQPIVDGIEVPAYLTDILTRLITWNSLLPKCLGQQAKALTALRHQPLIQARYLSLLQLRGTLEDVEYQLQQAVADIRQRLAPYEGEEWVTEFIKELCQLPDFAYYWGTSAAQPNPEPSGFTPKIQVTARYYLPETDAVLQFAHNSEPLPDDLRVMLVCLIPQDGFTLRTVERWRAEQAGSE